MIYQVVVVDELGI